MFETPTLIAICGAACGLVTAAIAILAFWMRFSDRITAAEATAESAQKQVEVLKKDADETQQQLQIHIAAFGLYREQVASEYIHREVMREVEDRLTNAINRLADRLDRVLERQSGIA